MLEEPQKKKKGGLKLVSRKSTKKMLSIGKWKKLDSVDKAEPEEKKEEKEGKSVIGFPLITAIEANPSFDGVPIPAFFRGAIDFVEAEGLKLEGIYRISSPKSRLDELESNAGREDVELNFFDAHEAAGLIKRFLRQLPDSLVTPETESIVHQCTCGTFDVCTCPVLSKMKAHLGSFERPTLYLIAYVFLHARKVISMESENKMSILALGLLLVAVLDMSQKMVCYLINNHSLFEPITIEQYIPPKSCASIESWKCEDKPLIEQELLKQNNLLHHLHTRISGAQPNREISHLEERLWQVQTAITALKRRLKAVAEPTTASSSGQTEERACSEMFEEKQLMAIQMTLKEEIREERQKIVNLLYQLYILEQENPVENKEDEAPEELKKDVETEETKRTELVTEIDQLRTECAHLRARIEMFSQGQLISTRF